MSLGVLVLVVVSFCSLFVLLLAPFCIPLVYSLVAFGSFFNQYIAFYQ